jgi:hypothetical protein
MLARRRHSTAWTVPPALLPALCEGMDQVVEHLPRNCVALGLILSTIKKK